MWDAMLPSGGDEGIPTSSLFYSILFVCLFVFPQNALILVRSFRPSNFLATFILSLTLSLAHCQQPL